MVRNKNKSKNSSSTLLPSQLIPGVKFSPSFLTPLPLSPSGAGECRVAGHKQSIRAPLCCFFLLTLFPCSSVDLSTICNPSGESLLRHLGYLFPSCCSNLGACRAVSHTFSSLSSLSGNILPFLTNIFPEMSPSCQGVQLCQ